MKRPFLIFSVVVGTVIAGTLGFIQSRQFAGLLKHVAKKYVPADLGVDGDFSEFSIGMFPPAVSVRNPKVVLKKKNFLGLPEGSKVSAERLDFVFLPFQMFYGRVRVNQVVVVKGDVQLAFDREFFAEKPKKKGLGRLKLGWDELLQVHVEAFLLRDTRVQVKFDDPAITAKLDAKTLRLGQWSSREGMGYELEVELHDVAATFPKGWTAPNTLDVLRGRAYLNPSGLMLQDLTLARDGVEARSSGKITGNVLESSQLLADFSLSLAGELPRITQFAFGKRAPKQLPSGNAVFSGRIKGDLKKPLETARAEGVLTLNSARFAEWGADRVVAEGSWTGAADGGEVAISRVVAEAKERSRSGAQPGWGGKIEIGEFKFRPSTMERVKVPLRLQRAHIHWLAAGGVDDVFPLDFRTDGSAEVTFHVPTDNEDWLVEADLNLKVDEFQFDNQKFGKVKPLHKIVTTSKALLKGRIVIDPETARMESVQCLLPRSKIDVGGEVNFETGYDLRFSGALDLDDIGELAGNEIRGKGQATVRVHGPASHVFIDFDIDVKDGYYLRMNLGDVTGRLTWDDGPGTLLFKGTRGKVGRTNYGVEGEIRLGATEGIHLDVDIPQGETQDLIAIFKEMVAPIWWFPSSLTGSFGGKGQIRGGVALDQLKILTTLQGPGWEYLGERFKWVEGKGGFDSGKYFLESFTARKHSGTLVGKISYSPDERMEWNLRSNGLTIDDFDHVARLDVPLRGTLSVDSSGSGKVGSITSLTRFTLGDFTVRGQRMPESELIMRSQSGILSLRGLALGGQGMLDASYDFRIGGSSYLRAALRGLDYSPVLLLLNPKTIQDPALAGIASGMLDLSFKTGEIERGSGRVEVSEFHLAKTGTQFSLVNPVSAKMDRGTFDIAGLAVRGNGGHAQLDLKSRSAELSGTISGTVDLSLLEFLTSSIADAAGEATLGVSIAGTLKMPIVSGQASIESGMIKVPAFETPIENVAGVLQLKQNIVTVKSLQGDLASGRANARGTVKLFPDRWPKVALSADIQGSKIKVFPFQFVKVSGRLNVGGETIPYLIDGLVNVESALSREKVMQRSNGAGFKSALYTPPPLSRAQDDSPRFKLKIDVQADRNVIIQNDLFDAEVKGRLTVVNTIEVPRLLGNAEMIRGKMVFKDRAFQIQSASMSFDNPAVINPKFNLTATTEVNDTKIQLYAQGRLDQIKIELSSNPVMAENEILSLLALGLTSNEVQKLRSGEAGDSFDQGEAASLVLHSLDFNRDVQEKTGFQIGLDGTVKDQLGTSIFSPKSSESTGTASPKITIKRKIGDRLDVSVGSTMGGGTGSQREVNAEVKILPGLSVIGVWDEGVEQQSYGVDLKLQKRFK